MLALACAGLLAACAPLPPKSTAPTQIDAGTLHLDAAAARAEWPADRWWEAYGDAQLNDLMAQALRGAPSLDLAAARVRQADAALASASAAGGVNLALNANLSREKLPLYGLIPPPFAGSIIKQARATLDFSYDFDWWGKNRGAVTAALDRTRAAELDLASARLVLATALAQVYFDYQSNLRRQAIWHDVLVLRDELLKLSAARLARGLDPIVPQRQAQGDIASAQFILAQVDANLALDRNQLALLLGRGPGDLPKLEHAALPTAGAGLPENVGIGLVARRPDIQAERWRVEAAARDIDVARARFYPDISIGAFVGVNAIGIEKIIRNGADIFAITPALYLPIFDAGRLQANLGVNQAELETAVAQYNQTVVEAVHQVADQATTLALLGAEQAALSGSLRSAEGVLEASRSRYEHGLADYAAVLQARAPVLAEADADAQLQARRLTAQVALIKALGGGFTAPAADTGGGFTAPDAPPPQASAH
jgi:multidrug efflux system outer membrane protein